MADESTPTTSSDSAYDLSSVVTTTLSSDYIVNDDVSVIDSDWISCRFMVSNADLDSLDASNRFFTTNQYKFTSSSIGGNIGINPRPQYTRYADIRGPQRTLKNPVRVTSKTGNHGMGRYYSEAIDDNAQTIFMEFGFAKFNSLVDFFTRAIDYEDSVIANTGRSPIGYKLGKYISGGLMLAAFPLVTLSIWALKLTNRLIFGNGNFDYYYLEPNMAAYWGTVSTIITQMCTEMGILIPELMTDNTTANRIGVPVKLNQDDLNDIKTILPGLIGDNNYIDIFAIATRAQTIANMQMLKDLDAYEENSNGVLDFVGYVKTQYSLTEAGYYTGSLMSKINQTLSFSNFLEKVCKGDGLYANNADEVQTPSADNTATTATNAKFTKESDGSYAVNDTPEKQSYMDKFAKALDSSVRDGGLYAAFYVDYTGAVSESFSNSIGNISINDKIKSLSSAARNVKFDLSGGNITQGLQTIAQGAKDILAGVADSVSFGLSSVIQTITGGGYIDLPKKWDDSDMSLPSITYNIQLVSPYGNVFSQLQNIYIPLAMLLAGTLPLSAGKSSYTSPYLCSLFTKGVQRIKLGMITSLTITRGVSNLGFNKQRRPLAIDVSFTVTDFSTRMTAPINGSIFDVFNVALEDDTPLGNYIATLASRDILTSKYTLPKIKIRASRALMKADEMISPAAWGLRVGETMNKYMGGLVADHSITLQHKN